MLSDITLAHDLVKSEMPESSHKTQVLHVLNNMLGKAKSLTDDNMGLKKQVKHLKGRAEKAGLENEQLRRLV